MKCPLCSAGNVETELNYGEELRHHLNEHHAPQDLAMALSDLLEILYQKRMNNKK